MGRVTVFGAGAMGTAVAMHLARAGNTTTLWASPHDGDLLPSLLDDRRHPGLPEYLPDSLTVLGPGDLWKAAKGIDLAVMGAHSGGARSLAREVGQRYDLPTAVVLAKGLEAGTGRRMSEVHREEIGHDRVVVVGGPCLAPEIAQGLPTAAVIASSHPAALQEVAAAFRSRRFRIHMTDDLTGLEYCTVAKNVAAIGMGILDGLGKTRELAFRNAKAALFTLAVQEITTLVVSLGGRGETVQGPAGLGDTLVTSLGGRNRLYGELVGEGADPERALEDLTRQGVTVEGVDSAREVSRLIEERGLDLPFHRQVHDILFASARPVSILECMRG